MKTCNYWIIGGIIAMAVILILAIKRNEGFRPTSTIARAGSCCGGRYLTPTYRQMAMLPGSFNSNYEGAGCCGIFDGCFCTKGKNSRIY